MNSTSKTLHYAVGDLNAELEITRRFLERAPVDQFSWQPHEKSYSMGKVVAHLVDIVDWGIDILRTDEFDFAVPKTRMQVPDSTEALLKEFDRLSAQLKQVVGTLREKDLERPWTLRSGEMVFFSSPKGDVFRRWCLSHIIHHRAQLGVCLRLLDVPVPQTYGPSADESGMG